MSVQWKRTRKRDLSLVKKTMRSKSCKKKKNKKRSIVLNSTEIRYCEPKKGIAIAHPVISNITSTISREQIGVKVKRVNEGLRIN